MDNKQIPKNLQGRFFNANTGALIAIILMLWFLTKGLIWSYIEPFYFIFVVILIIYLVMPDIGQHQKKYEAIGKWIAYKKRKLNKKIIPQRKINLTTYFIYANSQKESIVPSAWYRKNKDEIVDYFTEN